MRGMQTRREGTASARQEPPKWATHGRLVWALVVLAASLVAMNVAQAEVFAHQDVRLLDLRLGYSHAEVVGLFEAYGPGGRRAYAVALGVDTLYPLVLLAATVLATTRAFGHRRWLWLAPVGFAVLDIVENALFGWALASFPDIPTALVAVAAPVTVAKLVCFPPTVAALAIAIGRIGLRWRAGRRADPRIR